MRRNGRQDSKFVRSFDRLKNQKSVIKAVSEKSQRLHVQPAWDTSTFVEILRVTIVNVFLTYSGKFAS